MCGLINDAARPPEDRLKAYAGRGRLYLNTSKFDLALTDAEAALKLDPNSVQALLQRGIANQRTNKLDLAQADFDRALQIERRIPLHS